MSPACQATCLLISGFSSGCGKQLKSEYLGQHNLMHTNWQKSNLKTFSDVQSVLFSFKWFVTPKEWENFLECVPDHGQRVHNTTSRQLGNYVMTDTSGNKAEGASFMPLNPPICPETSSWDCKGGSERNSDLIGRPKSKKMWHRGEQSAGWVAQTKGSLSWSNLKIQRNPFVTWILQFLW